MPNEQFNRVNAVDPIRWDVRRVVLEPTMHIHHRINNHIRVTEALHRREAEPLTALCVVDIQRD
jgi:hypothetical protein